MVTRAQLSQDRSRLRREELLAAAISLFAEGGSRAITHRAVASRAGLPSATTTYYFESIDELIREALGSHVIQWTRELDAIAAADAGSAVSLDDASGFIAAVFAQRGPEVAALELSIFLAAARQPELRDVADGALRALEALTARMLTRVGVTDTSYITSAIVALVAGTAMRRQSGVYPEAMEARFLTTAIRDLVAAHTIGPAGVDAAIASLRESQP